MKLTRTRFFKVLSMTLVLFGTGTFSINGSAQNLDWICDVTADLSGIPASFIYFNKDSWEGTGELSCIRNSEKFNTEIEVEYEGWASATGLAGKSELSVFSYFIPATKPEDILQTFTTASMATGGEYSYYYDLPVTAILQVGQYNVFSMAVKASQPHNNLHVPLNYGTISIRKSQP